MADMRMAIRMRVQWAFADVQNIYTRLTVIKQPLAPAVIALLRAAVYRPSDREVDVLRYVFRHSRSLALDFKSSKGAWM